MHSIRRRNALGYSALAVGAIGGITTASAASPIARPLTGRSGLILGETSLLTKAIHDGLAAAGASLTQMPVPELSEAAWETALVTGSSRPSRVDLIVNLCIPERGGAFGVATLADFRKIIEGSYASTYMALKYGSQLLQNSGGGLFVNITSIDGKYGAADSAARCAAANGITIMTKSAALELAAQKPVVRVNALLIGEIVDGKDAKLTNGQVSVRDVAAAVNYLTADASIYLTGLIMPVDNGGGPR